MLIKYVIKAWLLPVFVALGLFVAIRPIFAQVSQEQTDISSYLATNDVLVGLENKDGYTQIYYVFSGRKVFITSGNTNHRHPDSKGEYITYVGNFNEEGQVFLYHITTKSTLQLTNTGVNLEPKVNRAGQVVWERWVGNTRQLVLFDGSSVNQITQGDLAINPDIEGDKIIYARQDLTGTWRAELYSIKEKKKVDVTTGDSTQHPKLKEGKILLSNGSDNFPLRVEDLFVLDLDSLVTNEPQAITERSLLEELTSSPCPIPSLTPTP
jgi:hypothetical protein